jgi:C4-dicarboxylate transporter
MKHRIVALGLMIATAFAGLAPTAAVAGEKQAKNVAIAATVVSAVLLGSKKTRTAGIVGAAGSAYLWKKYSDSRQARSKREKAELAYYRRAAARNTRASRSYRHTARR